MSIYEENTRRNAALLSPYDPFRGIAACGERLAIREPSGNTVYVPKAMVVENSFAENLDQYNFDTLRFLYDFEFWAAKSVAIPDKLTHRLVSMQLNRPQRQVLAKLEEQRQAGKPVRAIILKARQCGISTLVEAYIAWLQLIHNANTNCIVCAQNKDTANALKGIYSNILMNYPAEYSPEKPYKFKPFEKTANISQISGRSNTVTVCSAESPAAIRGIDISLAHLSEVAFWRKTKMIDPLNVIRSISGSVALTSGSVIIMESTANGLGNFFHEEWLRASAGKSDKVGIFIPWFEHTIYSLPIDDAEAFYSTLDDYEKSLWNMGATLEQINWYRHKNLEYQQTSSMQAEFPSTDVEAFTATDKVVFSPMALEKMRENCCAPKVVGEVGGMADVGEDSLSGLSFIPDSTGKFKVWEYPEHKVRHNRYIVTVDIGGRSADSDYSVIYVLDRGASDDCKPSTVAQWRGHADMDVIAWKSAQIAKYYSNALLVIESNTLETKSTEGENSKYILDELGFAYSNLYRRRVGGGRPKPGFHTNRQTKQLIVNRQIASIREGRYIERDSDAINEHLSYERKDNGSYGAKDGHHDDILMTRCIALSVAWDLRNSRSGNIDYAG